MEGKDGDINSTLKCSGAYSEYKSEDVILMARASGVSTQPQAVTFVLSRNAGAHYTWWRTGARWLHSIGERHERARKKVV